VGSELDCELVDFSVASLVLRWSKSLRRRRNRGQDGFGHAELNDHSPTPLSFAREVWIQVHRVKKVLIVREKRGPSKERRRVTIFWHDDGFDPQCTNKTVQMRVPRNNKSAATRIGEEIDRASPASLFYGSRICVDWFASCSSGKVTKGLRRGTLAGKELTALSSREDERRGIRMKLLRGKAPSIVVFVCHRARVKLLPR
jgi:hypothetical protein